jgi:hypothetical protein
VPLHLPYQSGSPTGTPLAGCPQRFGLVIQLHFTQHIFAMLVYKLDIHHHLHPRFYASGGFFKGLLLLSVTLHPGGTKLNQIGVDPLHAVIAGHREAVVAIQDEVEAPLPCRGSQELAPHLCGMPGLCASTSLPH